jgi:hypothetical protein
MHKKTPIVAIWLLTKFVKSRRETTVPNTLSKNWRRFKQLRRRIYLLAYGCRISKVLIPPEKCMTLFLQSPQLFHEKVD